MLLQTSILILRNVGGQAQAISMLRNTLLISLLLGLTWMVGKSSSA